MSAYVDVYKSIVGDWNVGCYECDEWLGPFETWREAQDKASRHALAHEVNRCDKCGRS